jgi:1-acyl-sn-glycerol-3-phosphate acyltransferase
MVPVLLVLTAKESYYGALWKLVRAWSFILIYGMGFRLKIEEEEQLDENQSYMFCANHASLMDPFVLIALSKKPIVFVGKKELVKIPIFGFFYKRVVIMVDRGSHTSRKKVYERARKKLKNGVSIGIFPEGGVPDDHVVLGPFKNGAFNLAIEHKIPIAPQTYYDNKRLFSWDVLRGGMGVLRVKKHAFIETKDIEPSEMKVIRDQTFNVIYNELSNDQLYMKDTNQFNERKDHT